MKRDIYQPELLDVTADTQTNKKGSKKGSGTYSGPSGMEMATGIAGGLASIISNGVNNINSVNGDMQYNTLKALSNYDYAPGTTEELLSAYSARPTIKTDYTFKDVNGRDWEQIIAGSFEDSLSGFTAGMQTGNPYVTAILAAAGGVSGLATGIIGRQKAKRVADDLNTRGNILQQQDIAKLGNAAANSDFMNLNFARDGGNIYIKPENRGKFTALKERTGHSATWFKENGTPAQKKMATFALNARKWKHEDGGMLATHGIDWSNGVTYFNTGGSHEDNPMGGILQGFDSMGNPNVVEQGEVKYKDYIYSKKNKIKEKYLEQNDLDSKYEGHTFADAAKDLSKESEERPNDPISKRTQEDNMARLASAQDDYNLDEAKKKLKKGIDNLNQEDLMYLAEALNFAQQPQLDSPGVISDEEALQMQDNQQTFRSGGRIPRGKKGLRKAMLSPISEAKQEQLQRDTLGFNEATEEALQRIVYGDRMQRVFDFPALGESEQEALQAQAYRNRVAKLFPNSPAGYSESEQEALQYYLTNPKEKLKRALGVASGTNAYADGGWINWLEGAPVWGAAGQVLFDTAGLTNKDDFSAYDAARDSFGRIRDVSAGPIGGYLGYTRPDTTYAANLMRSQYANNARNLANLSGGNRGTAMAGLLTNANNFRSSLGDYLLQAEKEARDARLAYAQYNTGIREKEVANSLAAQQANQNKDLAITKSLLDYGRQLQAIKDANDEAKGHNFSQLADLLGKYGRSLRAFRDRDIYANTVGNPGAENSYYGGKKKGKKKKDEEEEEG